MGAWKYCDCSEGMNAPSASELLYGQECHWCKKRHEFSTSEKVDYLLEKQIERENAELHKSKSENP